MIFKSKLRFLLPIALLAGAYGASQLSPDVAVVKPKPFVAEPAPKNEVAEPANPEIEFTSNPPAMAEIRVSVQVTAPKTVNAPTVAPEPPTPAPAASEPVPSAEPAKPSEPQPSEPSPIDNVIATVIDTVPLI